MVCLGGREFGVSYLVDHQHTRGGVAAQALPHQTRIGGRIQRLGQVSQGGKQSRVACCQSLHRKGQAQMRFSNTRRPKKNHIRSALDERQVSQFPQQALREAGLEAKIKGLQGFEGRQACCCHAPFGGAAITPFNPSGNRMREEGLVGPRLLPCGLKKGWQGFFQLCSAQLLLLRLHEATPPPYSWSYSASARVITWGTGRK